MTEYRKGQRVHVEFDGVISNLIGHTAWVIPEDSPGRQARGVPFASLTPAEPKDWPPQEGDIWATKDGEEPVLEWFARRRGRTEGAGLVLMSSDGQRAVVEKFFKDRSPVLVRRRDQ